MCPGAAQRARARPVTSRPPPSPSSTGDVLRRELEPGRARPAAPAAPRSPRRCGPALTQRLHQLRGGGGDRHRHVELAGGGQPEVEVLAQQHRRERRREVQVHVRRGLVPGERRAHHAVVEELEERGPRHAALLGEHGDLGQRLGDHAEHEVVADLHQPRRCRPRRRTSPTCRCGRAGGRPCRRSSSGPDTTRVRPPEATTLPLPLTGAARKSTPAAAHSSRIALRGLDRDGRAVDHRAGQVLRVDQQAALAEQHLLEVGRGGHHREDHVAVAQVGDRVGDARSPGPRSPRPWPGCGSRPWASPRRGPAGRPSPRPSAPRRSSRPRGPSHSCRRPSANDCSISVRMYRCACQGSALVISMV